MNFRTFAAYRVMYMPRQASESQAAYALSMR